MRQTLKRASHDSRGAQVPTTEIRRGERLVQALRAVHDQRFAAFACSAEMTSWLKGSRMRNGLSDQVSWWHPAGRGASEAETHMQVQGEGGIPFC